MVRPSVLVRAAGVVLALVVVAPPVSAYLEFAIPIRGVPTVLKWKRSPVRWFARDSAANGVAASVMQATVARAFGTWEAVPTASIGFSFVGFTSASPFDDDGVSVIGFENEPNEDRVLGSTGFTIDITTGEIVEADIFLNSAFLWSTSAAGDPARFDLESVVLHEIGHFLGLGHSALGETQLLGPDSRRVLASGSVMFPIAFGRGNTLDRTLQADDIAGVSSVYPDGDVATRTGTAKGRVLKNGRGVFGAHVVAFNVQTGRLIGGFTLNASGEFAIGGLTPGPHVIRVEPLDDASVESFFDAKDPVDANFAVTYASRLVVVPAGGTSQSVDITVAVK
jgi:hypothetical protein